MKNPWVAKNNPLI